MVNIRKQGYFKPVKPNNGAWDLKRRARNREGKPGKENVNGKKTVGE